MHETPDRTKLGVDASSQELPSHVSANPPYVPSLSNPPTAMQSVELTHDKARRKVDPPLLPFALGTIDQAVPFQDSIRVCPSLPTVWQLVESVHVTAARVLLSPASLGLGTIDHELPSQVSTKV
jgi:hypothetical protein